MRARWPNCWFGRHPENIRHLLAVTVSEGIGVGLLVNGQLLHGGHAMAGEFGHVTIDEQDLPVRAASVDAGSATPRTLRPSSITSTGRAPRSEISRASKTCCDSPITAIDVPSEALERMARYLGLGLAGLATGLAPEVIVMVGEMTAAWDRLGPIVLGEVKKRTLPHVTTHIVPTDPSTQPRLRGAVTLVVQQHFGARSVA